MKKSDKTKLQRLGFFEEWSDDKSASWMRLNMEHPLISGLHLTVEKSICVWCEEAKGHQFEGHTSIILNEQPFTVENLYKVLAILGMK